MIIYKVASYDIVLTFSSRTEIHVKVHDRIRCRESDHTLTEMKRSSVQDISISNKGDWSSLACKTNLEKVGFKINRIIKCELDCDISHLQRRQTFVK